MAAAATRDIVFRLKAQADPGAKAAMDAFAKNAVSAQQVIDQAVVKSGQKKAAAAELYAGETLKHWEKESKKLDSMLLARAQKAKEMAAQVASANQKMSAGFDKASEGIIKLGRGLAMSGLIGEENLQKLTDGLLKVQAASDLVRGGKDLIGGVSAMSSAGSAAGAAGGGGMAAGIGAVAAPALAAAAALASVALAGQVVYETLSGQAAKQGSVSDTIAGYETDIIGWVDSFGAVAATVDFLRPVMSDYAKEMVDVSRGARDSAKAFDDHAKSAAKAAADRQQIDRNTANDLRNRAKDRAGQQSSQDMLNRFAVEQSGAGLTGNDKAALLNEQAQLDIAKEIAAAQADMVEAKKGGLESEQQAAQVLLSANERAVALKYEQLGIVKQEKAEAIATLREQLAGAQQLYDRAKSNAKQLADANKSDYQRFADLDVEQKKQLVAVRDKLDKGGALTKEEADLAGGFNEFKDRVGANRASVGAKADTFGLFNAGQQRAARAAEQAGAAQDKKFEINNRLEVTVNNSSDEKAVIDALRPMIEMLIKSQRESEEVAKRKAADEFAKGSRQRAGAVAASIK